MLKLWIVCFHQKHFLQTWIMVNTSCIFTLFPSWTFHRLRPGNFAIVAPHWEDLPIVWNQRLQDMEAVQGNSCRDEKVRSTFENCLGYSMLFGYSKSHSVEAKEHLRYLKSSSLDIWSLYLVCEQTSPTISADSTKVWSTLEHFVPAADSCVSILGFWVRYS